MRVQHNIFHKIFDYLVTLTESQSRRNELQDDIIISAFSVSILVMYKWFDPNYRALRYYASYYASNGSEFHRRCFIIMALCILLLGAGVSVGARVLLDAAISFGKKSIDVSST